MVEVVQVVITPVLVVMVLYEFYGLELLVNSHQQL
jgi:hypothetical protein